MHPARLYAVALAAAVAVGLPPASRADAEPKAPDVRPARVALPAPPADEIAFGHVSVTVSQHGEVRQMSFLPGKAQRIPGTLLPTAVEFRPHTADAVEMLVYTVLADGSMQLASQGIAGKRSLQFVGGYATRMELRTGAAGEKPGC